MILKDLSGLIFDALPLNYDAKKKIILTNLFDIGKQVMPYQMCTIFTTRTIADRFSAYCDSKGYEGLKKDNFVYVEPYTATDIIIDGRRTLKMLFCESGDLSKNLMVLIKEDNRPIYVYAGYFTDMRAAALNESFTSWFGQESVDYLYLNLKKTSEDHESEDIEQIEEVFKNIRKILEYHVGYGIIIYIPPLGYEYFIQKISERFPNRVALSPKFQALFSPDNEALENMCESIDSAKIVLFHGEPNSKTARENHKNHKRINVCLRIENALTFKLQPDAFYYELLYSPEPSPFDLKLMTALIKPKRIFGIIEKKCIKSKVPKYLIELCGGKEERPRGIKEKPFSNPTQTEKAKEGSKVVVVGPLANKVKDGLYLDDSDSD